jgi:hypothetical protein
MHIGSKTYTCTTTHYHGYEIRLSLHNQYAFYIELETLYVYTIVQLRNGAFAGVHMDVYYNTNI